MTSTAPVGAHTTVSDRPQPSAATPFSRAFVHRGLMPALALVIAAACSGPIATPARTSGLDPSLDAPMSTPAIGQSSTSLPSSPASPWLTADITPLPSLSSPAVPSGPHVSVESHDRFWDPFVDLGPPIGLPYGLRTVRDATELADLVIVGSITDLYIGEQWIGASDEPGMPFGYVKVRIQETLKGEPVSRSDEAVEVQFAWGHRETDFELISSEPLPVGEYLWFLIHEATFVIRRDSRRATQTSRHSHTSYRMKCRASS